MKIKKIIVSAVFILLSFTNLYSQNLFKDDFSYPVQDSLEGLGNWSRTGVNFPTNVQVKSPGLTYAGYAGSGIGNTAYFPNTAEGDIVLHNFTPQSSGKVYAAFMFRVDSLTATATNGYNIVFNQSTGATFFNTQLFVKKVSASTFNFGIKKTRNISYSSTAYNTNTTYLIVLKYSFVNGADNDSSKMYVFTSGVPSNEPAVPNAFATDSIDITNIGQVMLSNNYAVGPGLRGSSVKIDGIRVGLSWAGSVLSNVNLISNLIPDEFSLSQNYPNPFNPFTKIGFKIPQEGNVKLQVFDITGKSVSVLANEKFAGGEYSVSFGGGNLPSGTYFYKMDFSSKDHSISKILKMTLLK